MEPPKTSLSQEINTRQPLVQAAAQALSELGDQTGPALLTFWGCRGSGKTTLLETIRHQLAEDPKTDDLGSWDLSAVSLETVLSQARSAASNTPEHSRKLVGLDNLDALLRMEGGIDRFSSLERALILPLIEGGDTLILTTSRSEIVQWRDYETRTRSKNIHIPLLSREEVTGVSECAGIAAERLFELGLGHPQVTAWYCQQPGLSEAEGAARAADFFLEDFPRQAREAAETAALLPLFNTLVLRNAMDNAPDESEARLVFYIDQVKHMIRMGMVFWDYGMYRFTDSAVRRLIARHIRLSAPERFIRIHREAAGYFEAEARAGAFLHLHLVPAVYHLAHSEPGLEPAEAGLRCCEWVQNSQKRWLEARWPEVRSAWRSGAGDPDLVQELIALIGRESYDRIAALLESFQSKMEVPE